MSRLTPGGCPRGVKAECCEPLHRVMSDDGSTYVCCGMVNQPVDSYQLCFVTRQTESAYDCDELDLLDMVEVITRALSSARRLKARCDRRRGPTK